MLQGWSSWYAFGADINETKIVQMADAIVEHGLRDAGCEFVSCRTLASAALTALPLVPLQLLTI